MSTDYSSNKRAAYYRQLCPDKVPVMLIPLRQRSQLATFKFLVPKSASYSHFVRSVRKYIEVKAETGLYFYVANQTNSQLSNQPKNYSDNQSGNHNKELLPTGYLMSEVDQQFTTIIEGERGYLYIYYDLENTFG